MMSRDFIAYWKPGTAHDNSGRLLDHSGSEQYHRVKRGDTVWIVTCKNGSLHLLGRIIVGCVTDQREAEIKLGKSDLWRSNYHIIAAKGTEEPIKDIPISHLAASLRFESDSGRDRLLIADSRIQAQQLQTMRVLDSGSAALLAKALGDDTRPTVSGRAHASLNPRSAPKRQRKSINQNRALNRISVAEPALINDRPGLLATLRKLQTAGLKSDDLLKRQYRDSDRSEAPLSGLCYVLSECMFHLFPGRFTTHRINWGDGDTHWFLRCSDGSIFDTIANNAAECCEAEDYASARRVGFLTKQPSKRAQVLVKRAGLEFPK